MYTWMHVLQALKKNLIWLIIYIFIIKILFNFKCIHAFAWSYMLNTSLYRTWSSPSLVSFTNGNQGKDTKSSQSHFYHIWLWATISLILRCSKEIISHYPPESRQSLAPIIPNLVLVNHYCYYIPPSKQSHNISNNYSIIQLIAYFYDSYYIL